MLSIKNNNKNIPICKVIKGKFKDKIIYIQPAEINSDSESDLESEEDEEVPFDYDLFIDHEILKKDFKKKKDRRKQVARIRNILSGKRKNNRKIDELIKEAKKLKSKMTKKEIKFGKGEGRLELIPNINEREVIYIGGAAGSGKSWVAGHYMARYKKLYPKNPIYVFSRKKEDKSIDDFVKSKRFILDMDLVNDPIDFHELVGTKSGCFVLFDDCNSIQNKKINKAILALQNDILEVARSKNIYIIVTNHKLSDREKTKTILNECHYIIVFPRVNRQAINYTLQTYMSLTKGQISKICRLKKNSRWVAIYKNYPQHVIHEKGVYTLD